MFVLLRKGNIVGHTHHCSSAHLRERPPAPLEGAHRRCGPFEQQLSHFSEEAAVSGIINGFLLFVFVLKNHIIFILLHTHTLNATRAIPAEDEPA